MAGSTPRRPARARRNGAASLKTRPELGSGRLALRGAQPGRDAGHPVRKEGRARRSRPRPHPGPQPPHHGPGRRPGPGAARRGRRTPGAWTPPRPAHLPPAGCTPRRAGHGGARAGPGLSRSPPRPPSAPTHPPGRPARRGGLRQVGRSGAASPQPRTASRGAGGERRTQLRDERGRRLPGSASGLTSCVPGSCCPAPDIIPPPLPAPRRDALPLLRPEALMAPPWRLPTYLLRSPAAASAGTRRTKEAGAAPGWKRGGRACVGSRGSGVRGRGERGAKSGEIARFVASVGTASAEGGSCSPCEWTEVCATWFSPSWFVLVVFCSSRSNKGRKKFYTV